MLSFKNSLFTLITIVLFVSCTNDSSIENIKLEENSSITQEVHRLINKHRVSLGKSALIFNDPVTKIALEHTNYMISKNKISHDNFDNRFIELRKLVKAKSMGENVASGQSTATEVVQGWLNSPGHKKNIEGNYTHTGIGISKNNKGRYYFTQIFYSK